LDDKRAYERSEQLLPLVANESIEMLCPNLELP
jgi:hypothetical protein